MTVLLRVIFCALPSCRMWEFSVGLYMINVWPDSLLFAAIYGVVESASIALFGSIVGKWVDRFTYVQVISCSKPHRYAFGLQFDIGGSRELKQLLKKPHTTFHNCRCLECGCLPKTCPS